MAFSMLKNLRGFTLVELLLVLILIGIMAVIAVPNWVGSPNLEAQTQALLSDLRYTQALAMTHGQRFDLNFTLPSSYGISDPGGTAVANPSTGASTVSLVSGTTMSSLTNLPNNLISFDERGVPYTDSAATVALTANATIVLSANGITRNIIITPETGSMVAQ